MIFLIWELVIALGVVFLDLLTKKLAETLLVSLPGYSFPLIDGVLHFTYARNTGAAFSMLEGQRTFFIVVAVLAVIAMVAFLIYSKNPSKLLKIGVALMLGGTVGNTVDRVLFGYVRDMIDFRLINFAIFNIADSALCIGVGLIVVYVLFFYKPDDKKKKEDSTLSDDSQASEDLIEQKENVDGE